MTSWQNDLLPSIFEKCRADSFASKVNDTKTVFAKLYFIRSF